MAVPKHDKSLEEELFYCQLQLNGNIICGMYFKKIWNRKVFITTQSVLRFYFFKELFCSK